MFDQVTTGDQRIHLVNLYEIYISHYDKQYDECIMNK